MNPEQLIKNAFTTPDWAEEYAKQRYTRLCDTIAEYIEAEEGIVLFEKDFATAIKELSRPLEQQLAVLKDIESSFDL